MNKEENMGDLLRTYIKRHPVRTQRFLEILPGFVSWSLILFPFWGSLIFPTLVAYYVIGFAVYWLYRSLTMSFLAIVAHFKIKAASKFTWVEDLQNRFPDKWDTIHHIIVIPTYKEPLEILERTLSALAKQSYPLKNLHIMVSFEERGQRRPRKSSQPGKEI